jgi:hypothetical protein
MPGRVTLILVGMGLLGFALVFALPLVLRSLARDRDEDSPYR